MYLVGKCQALLSRNHNELTMYPLGKGGFAPSDGCWVKRGRERWIDGEKSKIHSSFNEFRRPYPKPITWSTTPQTIINNQTASITIRNNQKLIQMKQQLETDQRTNNLKPILQSKQSETDQRNLQLKNQIIALIKRNPQEGISPYLTHKGKGNLFN